MLKRTTIAIVIGFICTVQMIPSDLYGEVPTPTKSSNEQENEAKGNQQNPGVIGTITPQPVPLVSLPITPDTKIKSTEESQNKNDKTTADWWLVYFTAALVAVVFMQFLWMVRQEKWMRRNVEIAQGTAEAAKKSADSLQAIERARLFVKVRRDPPPKKGEPVESQKEGHHRLLINIINEGKSLAIITKINWYIGVLNDKKSDNELSILESTTSEFPDGLITIRGNDSEDIPVMYEITNSDLHKINYSNTYLVCLGYIKYKDVFRKVRPVIFYWKDNGVFFFSAEPPTHDCDTENEKQNNEDYTPPT